MNYKQHGEMKQKSLPTYLGNNVKSMHGSLKDSLRKLRTDYVDILYVHWWDFETPVEEVMNGLHNLVVQGKVLYLVRYPTLPPEGLLNLIYRAFRTHPLGLLPELTCTHNFMGKLLSSSIKAAGTSWIVLSSEISFPWRALSVHFALLSR